MRPHRTNKLGRSDEDGVDDSNDGKGKHKKARVAKFCIPPNYLYQQQMAVQPMVVPQQQIPMMMNNEFPQNQTYFSDIQVPPPERIENQWAQPLNMGLPSGPSFEFRNTYNDRVPADFDIVNRGEFPAILFRKDTVEIVYPRNTSH